MPTGDIGGYIMILKDFKDIYNCKDIEYLRTIPRSRIKLFFETAMVENPDYIRKLKTNNTLEYLCRPLFNSIQNSYSVDLGKMIKILKEEKDKIYSKDLCWAILFMPMLCYNRRNMRANDIIKTVYVYLRNIGVPEKRVNNVLKFILFFDASRNHDIKDVKELIMIFGRKRIIPLMEIKKRLYEMKYPSKDSCLYYANMCLEYTKHILGENEICSFSKCPINKNIDLSKAYSKRLVDLKYILACEFYFGYIGDKPDDQDFFHNTYKDVLLRSSIRDNIHITNFYNLCYYGLKGRLKFD